MPTYTLTVHVDTDPATAEERIRAALADEGFGILTEIDVQATLKTKLDHDMRPYKILGACSPPLAKQAIETDEDIGALLPCNVLLRAHPAGGTEIVAADPEQMLAISSKASELNALACDAKERIQRALATVAGA